MQASLDEVDRMKKMLEEMLALARLENVDLSSEELIVTLGKYLIMRLKTSNFYMRILRLYLIISLSTLSMPGYLKIILNKDYAFC